VKKYAEASEAMIERNDATAILAECERLEKKIGDNPASVLYSDKWESQISYRQKVLEIENDIDDFLFSLAGNKGETIDSLKSKTVTDIHSFAERLTKQ